MSFFGMWGLRDAFFLYMRVSKEIIPSPFPSLYVLSTFGYDIGPFYLDIWTFFVYSKLFFASF